MTLAEKIAALRGERKLSQGDLAEKLDVSRQSVSKWETGQAVPELDKIIKLADVFGVTVDELVRGGDLPRAEDEPKMELPPTAEPKIVYVERPRRYTPVQTLGILLSAGGLVMMLAMFIWGAGAFFIGAAVFILGIPLLLAKKHPLLIDGWLVWLAGCLTLYNPMLTGAGWKLLDGFAIWWKWMTNAEEYIRSSAALLLAFAFLGVSLLTVLLPIYTGWLCWKGWKGRKRPKQETDG